MTRKRSFPSNWLGNEVFASFLYVSDSFCVFVPRKLPKKRDFLEIFCKKSFFLKKIFCKNIQNGDGSKRYQQNDFQFDFFCSLFVFISHLCFLMSKMIFLVFSIFLKNCSAICSFSRIG